jgi:hypothetical protein
MEENNELIKMVAKSVVTAKGTRCLHKLTS